MMPPNSADSGPAAAVLLLMCCCCVPILCALAAAIVAFYVFGIMFLVQDQDVCSYRSPLWIWGVCTLSLNCFVGLITPAISPRPNPEALAQAQAEGNYQVYMAGTALQTIPTYVLSVALTISGLVIIYGDFVCSEMKTVGLYEWSQFAVWILFTIACCGFGGFLAIPEYYEYEATYLKSLESMDDETTPISPEAGKGTTDEAPPTPSEPKGESDDID